MTDKELLLLCADAFDATLVADNARKLLKSGRIVNGAAENFPYAGNRSHVLAKVMREKVRAQLESDKITMRIVTSVSQIAESKLDPAYAAGYSDGLSQGEQMQAAHVEDLERKIALVMAHDSNLIDHLERYAAQELCPSSSTQP